MNSFFKFSILLVITLFLKTENTAAQKKDNYAVQIDSLVRFATEPFFSGVVLISKNGQTLYSKAKGDVNYDNAKQISLNTQFKVMSLSKQITATLILLEVEKGKIDLNAPIKKYLPELTQTWADSVTVHQLLNHSHGIIDVQKPLAFKPGTDFKYGDLGFSLLGRIVEFSTQQSYAEVADAFFRTLKMYNTLCYSKYKTQNLAFGLENTNSKNLNVIRSTYITPQTLGANGIISTAPDLVTWNNNLHKGKILKPETYQLMIKYNILSQHNLFGKEKEGYGYGLRIIEKEPYKYVGHTGLGEGFSAVNLYFPKSDISLIVLENQMNSKPDLFYANEIKIKNILFKSDLLNQK